LLEQTIALDSRVYSFSLPADDPLKEYIVPVSRGEEPVAGIFDIRGSEYDGVAEGWMPYIAVDDVDARVKNATKAGAKVMKPAFDVPGVGRIVILKEPGGAGIGWMTPAD
jgi:predicted enzyme related to lactoylglutathione lyase